MEDINMEEASKEQEKIQVKKPEVREIRISKKLIIAILLLIIVIWYIINTYYSKPDYDDFAKCLSEKGATLYGEYQCGFCKSQKEMFGSSIQYINYIECDPAGPNANPNLCNQNGILRYPTWIYNGEKREGLQDINSLSEWTGCSL